MPDVSPILTPESATQIAESAAASLLAASSRWRPSLEGRTSQPPLLVQRLDRDDYYYIVAFRRDKRETARLIVTAITALFTEASAVEKEGESLPPYIPPTLTTHYGYALEFPGLRNRVLRLGTVGQHPVLVWKPCRESSAPFMPFYLLTVGDRVVYWRVDGKMFDALTDSPA